MKRIPILFILFLLSLPPTHAQFFRNLLRKPPADTIVGRDRVDEVFSLIHDNYVDTPNTDRLSDEAIRRMLRILDPHCLYIPAKDVERANENLQGNFIGIGITFNLIRDSVVVIDLTPGGVAERVGMQRGDRLVKVDGHPLVGDTVNNATVSKYVRGPQGSKAEMEVVRHGKTITFHLTRDRINIPSVTPCFMVDSSTGYICVVRFARNTLSEFNMALRDLKKQGMKNLLLDLRGNTGGFLDIAIGLANEFLDRGDLIVYTQGRTQKRTDAAANGRGNFRAKRNPDGSFTSSRLVVMLDEHSASASEVLSGALQDHDRAVIVGRRSFGKGLVQRVYTLRDGGQVRLTTARYYTPSGRCIQKPYGDSINYNDDIHRRLLSGELTSADSIHFPDSLKFQTRHGRTVYGGGGIVPDVFVPLDTARLDPFVATCRRKNVVRDFAQDFADGHRDFFPPDSAARFLDARFSTFNLDSLFTAYAADRGYTRDSLNADTALWTPDRVARSEAYLHSLLMSEVAQRLFGMAYYYRVMKDFDDLFHVALEEIRK